MLPRNQSTKTSFDHLREKKELDTPDQECYHYTSLFSGPLLPDKLHELMLARPVQFWHTVVTVIPSDPKSRVSLR